MAKKIRTLTIKAPRRCQSRTDQEKIAILEEGKDGIFWAVLCDYLNERIGEAKALLDNERFSELPAEEYKIRSEFLKKSIKDLENLKDAPSTYAESLREPPRLDDVDEGVLEDDEDL